MEITGQILKENREKVKLSLNEVSLATKINVKILTAIEEGNKENLPALTFLRGFVRTYARYLKLDEESIMQTFYEEMGTSKPQKLKKASESEEEENPDTLIHSKSLTSRYVAVFGIIALIVLILFIRQVVDKYEKEAEIPPPEDIREIVQQPQEPLKEDTDNSDNKETSKNQESLVPNNAVPEVAQEKINKTKEPAKEPASESKPAVQEVKVAPTVPEKKPQPEAKPPKKQELKIVEKETPKPPPKIEVKPKPILNPQEIIIEALDNTQFSFKIDNNDRVKVSLKAAEIHVIKANSNVVLNLADGGAVSLIHNGRRKGVPGDLGRSIKLRFP